MRHATHMRGLLAIILLAGPLVAAEAAGTTNHIAVYGEAVAAENPPAGWSFEWNANGAMGESSAYEPLKWTQVKSGRRTRCSYAVPDEDGQPRQDRPRISTSAIAQAARDEGELRYAIAAYTMQNDADGDIWIQHGNAQNRGLDNTPLEIWVNDRQVWSKSLKRAREPLLFQVPLGRLKKGDTIRVAVGPARDRDTGGLVMLYVIAEVSPGAQPQPPMNILSPPITAAEPRRDPDGGCRTYSKKHRALCDTVRERRPELVFLGDSITARWPADMLEDAWAAYRPVNLGIGGDWIQNVHWRVLNGVLEGAPVRVVVLLIGTNNLSNRFTPEQVVQGIKQLVHAIQGKAPEARILLLGILPRPRSTGDEVHKVNALLARMADGKSVVFLDVGPVLVEPDGSVTREVMPDQLHVARPGFVRWIKAMRPILDDMLQQ